MAIFVQFGTSFGCQGERWQRGLSFGGGSLSAWWLRGVPPAPDHARKMPAAANGQLTGTLQL